MLSVFGLMILISLISLVSLISNFLTFEPHYLLKLYAAFDDNAFVFSDFE